MFLFNRTTRNRSTWLGLGLGAALLLGACTASAELVLEPDATELDPQPFTAEVRLGEEDITFMMYLCESEPGSFSAVGNVPGSEGTDNFPNSHFAFDWIEPESGEGVATVERLFIARGDQEWIADSVGAKGALSWDRDGDMVWGTAMMELRGDPSQTESVRFASHCPRNVG